MACVADLIHEVNSIEGFVSEQTLGGANEAELRKAQAICIRAKVSALKDLTTASATRLQAAVNAVGWDNDEKTALSASIRSQLDVCSAAQQKGSAPRRCNQTCMNFELWPTESDWGIFDDPNTPWSVKFQRAKLRCKSIGLMLPSEKTRGRILEVLFLASGLPLERDAQFFKQLDNLTECLDPLQKENYPFTHLAQFPLMPKMMAEDAFKHAYPDEQPKCREFLMLDFDTKNVRKSSKAYKDTQGPVSLCVPKQSPSAAMHNMGHMMGQQLMPMVQMCMHNAFAHMMQQHGGGAGSASSHGGMQYGGGGMQLPAGAFPGMYGGGGMQWPAGAVPGMPGMPGGVGAPFIPPPRPPPFKPLALPVPEGASAPMPGDTTVRADKEMDAPALDDTKADEGDAAKDLVGHKP